METTDATTTQENTQDTGDEGSSSSFFADAFDQLQRDGKLQVSADDAAPTAPTVPTAETAEPTEGKENTGFSAAQLLGLRPADEEPTEDAAPAEDAIETDDQIDSSVPDTITTSKERNAWVNLRRKERDQRKRIAELESRAMELEASAKTSDPEEVAALKAEVERYDREVSIARVEATRQFRDAVVAPMERVEAAADQFATKYEISKGDLMKALADDSNDALTDLAADFNERDRLRVYALAEEHTRVQKARQVILDNAKEARTRIEAREAQEATAAAESRKAVEAEARATYRAKLEKELPFFRKSDGADAWNKQIDDVEAFASTADLDSMPAGDRAAVIYRAALATPMYQLLTTLQAEHQAALDKLAKYQKASPGVGSGARTSEATVPVEDDEMSFADIMKKQLT